MKRRKAKKLAKRLYDLYEYWSGEAKEPGAIVQANVQASMLMADTRRIAELCSSRGDGSGEDGDGNAMPDGLSELSLKDLELKELDEHLASALNLILALCRMRIGGPRKKFFKRLMAMSGQQCAKAIRAKAASRPVPQPGFQGQSQDRLQDQGRGQSQQQSQEERLSQVRVQHVDSAREPAGARGKGSGF